MDANSGVSNVVQHKKEDLLPGKELIPYPEEGWSDPPVAVISIVNAAISTVLCMQATRRGNKKST